MEDNLTNANPYETAKIKTNHARIVVGGTAEKPCYSIEWYDPTENEYFLGYSSYYIGYVFKWLEECFEIVEAPKTNGDRIRAMNNEALAYLITTMFAEQEQKITKTLAEAGVDATLIELDFEMQAAIHKEWLYRAAEEEE